MKIKEVAALARDAGGVTLLNQVTEGAITRQWLVIGGMAVYPLDGLPVLDENTLRIVLDVPKKKLDSYKVHVQELDEFVNRYTSDFCMGDADAQLSHAEILLDGVRMRVAYDDHGRTVMVNTKWLKPLNDTKADMTYVVRGMDDEQQTLVVKNGMLNVLCVGSSDMWVTEKDADELHVMAGHAQRAERKNRERAANEGR